MKVLLIFLFIGLVGYLVIHMCGGFSGRRKKVIRQLNGVDKSLIILDNLISLNDRDLSRLKGEIQDLKKLLEKGKRRGTPKKEEDLEPDNRLIKQHTRSAPVGLKLSGRVLLQKIQREAREGIPDQRDDRRPSGFIPKIIVVNILLLLITVLVMLI
ncbi:MAG TPA: hypothetical protein HPQ03_03245 [Deltaproteobacteria bacterium]|nr:hypothetical protein [Deltaproteobacteria bacterium]